MTMYLGQSSVIHTQQQHNSVSITKKISHYIFKFEDKIGQGNFSKVYKGFHQLTNQQVAIKIVQLSSVKSAKLQQLLFSEIQVIQSLHHPNILKCHQVLKSENNCYIITELCNGGDLQSLLKRQKCLNQFSAAPYIRDIYKGLFYLGQRGIVHRDLKIANIFLHNGVCKIADFGFAKYTNNQNFHDLDIGSPLYMSPEGMIDHMYGMTTDIWAFGIILYQLLHGKTPFSYCTSEYELKRAVVTPISYQSLKPDLSNQMKQLIIKCLIVDSTVRPDALALKNDILLQRLLYLNNDEQKLKMRTDQSIPQHMMNLSMNESFHRQNVPQQVINQGIYVQNVQNPIIVNQTYPINQYGITHQHHQHSSHQIDYILIKKPQNDQGLEINNNSPNSSKAGKKNTGSKISQNSQKTSQNKSRLLRPPQQPQNQRIELSPNRGNHYSLSYGNIPQLSNGLSSNGSINYINYHKNETDKILVPQEHVYVNKSNEKNVKNDSKSQTGQQQFTLKPKTKVNAKSNDNLNKTINSVQSYNNVQNKKKFSKNYSHQNVNKIENQLIYPQTTYNPSIVNAVQQNNVGQSLKMQKSQKSQTLNNSQQKLNSSYSNKGLQIKVHEISNEKGSQNIQLNFKQSPKKFGQIIKGEKRPEGNVKSVIKLQKGTQSEANFLTQRSKTKSEINIDQNSIIDVTQSLSGKRRIPRHSHGNTTDFSDMDSMMHSISSNIVSNKAPSFIQQKQRMRQELKRNIICTIIDFKQAVGFLHYCRLYFRFVSTLKSIRNFPEVKKHDFFLQFFKNSQQNIEIYSRFLLTALNELIENIKCKQILYDGQNYKKKKLKQDKLKEVTQEYFRKYLQEINQNVPKNRQIVPTYLKSTSMPFIKEHNETFWQTLDREWSCIIQMSRKTNEISEGFMKQFRNLCYFSIRIIEANQIITNCIHVKNYKLLADTMIENWLGQEFYGEDVYFKLKNEYFRKLNSSNALQNSETNDTQTENKSRVNNLPLQI